MTRVKLKLAGETGETGERLSDRFDEHLCFVTNNDVENLV